MFGAKTIKSIESSFCRNASLKLKNEVSTYEAVFDGKTTEIDRDFLRVVTKTSEDLKPVKTTYDHFVFFVLDILPSSLM